MVKFLKSDLLKSWAVRIVLFISLIVNTFFGWNYYSGNTVTRVLDGDTFDLKNGTRVRLLDVESPAYSIPGMEYSRQIRNKAFSD